MKLRDHDQPCEHVDTYAHHIEQKYWWCEECPGGRLIEIDYEAAEMTLRRWFGASGGTKVGQRPIAHRIVDAALGKDTT